AGMTFSGTIGTFVDPDPGALARDYIATTEWGDGAITTSMIQPDSSGSGYDVVDAHTYAAKGDYTIKVIIQSYDGAGAKVFSDAKVAAAGSPAVTAGPAPSPGTVAVPSAGGLLIAGPIEMLRSSGTDRAGASRTVRIEGMRPGLGSRPRVNLLAN